MPVRGINSYKANVYSRTAPKAASQSDRLASLLKKSKNDNVLKKAYSAVSGASSDHLDRTDTSANEAPKFYQDSSAQTERAAKLSESTAALRESSVELMSSQTMNEDELADAVKKFADDYNNTVNSLKDSGNYVAVSSGINMVNTVRSYAPTLAKSGITVNDDNTLSVDEDALKKNAASAKVLFRTDSYSFGSKMMKKASDLQSLSKLTGVSAAGIYNRNGSF